MPDGLQGQGTKFVGGGSAVQFANDLQSFLDALVFANDLAVLTVVPLSEFPVGIDDLDDLALDITEKLPTIGQNLSDEAIVLGSAGCGVPFAEVKVPAVDGDDSLCCGLVAAIGRDAKGWASSS